MNKNDLLKLIADDGYNIGFGAKKHLATYDLIGKYPGWISLISISVGILSFLINCLSNNIVSAVLIIFGIATIYFERYTDKDLYNKAGKDLIILFDKVKDLYFHVKSITMPEDILNANKERIQIVDQYNKICISQQIFASDWYAHYKFFWQHQIGWIEEQKKFRLFRDKIPLSFVIFILLMLVSIVYIFLETHCRLR